MNFHIRKLLSAALFALIAASAPSFAQDTGWYVGLGIGQSTFVDSCTGVTGPGVSCKEKDTATKIFGGYQFNKNFAGEFGYSDLGQASLSLTGFGSLSIGAKGVELTGVGILPANEQVSVYVRFGFFRWNVDLEDGTGFIGSRSASGMSSTYGFGVRFALAKNAALRLEYQQFKDVGDANTTTKGDIDFIGVGLVANF